MDDVRVVETSEFGVPGLAEPVEIVVDEWGVPHIYAGSELDAYLAQGFNAARDRLYQIDLLRRRGHGLLAEVLGPEYVEQDKASRLFLYRGDLDAEWAAYGPQTRDIVRAFTSGINAYVAWVGDHPESLPPEFSAYGYLPARWAPEDVLLVRTHGLFSNAEHEVARSVVLRDFGPEVEELRQAREPVAPLVVPEGLDLSRIGDEILATYRLAFSPVVFAGRSRPREWQQGISGSNSWVVAPERTETGRPILANDPHRAVTLPSLRYIVHLEAPGLSAIGGGEPALPGISIGHNGSVGFGLTIWAADHEDLYIYELDPADPTRYHYGDGFESFRTVSERIDVAGGDPVVVDLAFTRHGPVIFSDTDRGFAVGLRAVWLEPGMLPYLGSLSYIGAKNAEEFLAGLENWGAPGVNQVYATIQGDIGWQGSALVPKRPNWDGSLPVPGDGRYEWDGFVRVSGLPRVQNPDRGWIATANEMNLPEGFSNEKLTITYDWYTRDRYERLEEWLNQTELVGIEDSVAMQSDSFNLHAREIISLLASVDSSTLLNAGSFEALRAWDGNESLGSFEGLLFEVWYRRHFRVRLAEHHLRKLDFDEGKTAGALPYVVKDESFGADLRGGLRMLKAIDWEDPAAVAALTAAIDETLAAAVAEIARLLGSDRAGWTWGALNHALLVNIALDAVPGVDDAWKRLPVVPRPGSGGTVGNVTYDADFRQTIGSTFRIVLDVGEWDSSRVMNSPGQSGDPRSPPLRRSPHRLGRGWQLSAALQPNGCRAARCPQDQAHPDLRGLTINESKHERKCNNECREDDGLSVI